MSSMIRPPSHEHSLDRARSVLFASTTVGRPLKTNSSTIWTQRDIPRDATSGCTRLARQPEGRRGNERAA